MSECGDLRGSDDLSLCEVQGVDKTCRGEGRGGDKDFGNRSENALGVGEDRRLAHARRADKDNIKVREKVRTFGLSPDFPFKDGREDSDACPLTKDWR